MRAFFLAGLLSLAPACSDSDSESDSADPFAAERAFAQAHARAACALYDRCGLLDLYGSSLAGCTTDLEAATFTHVTTEDCSFDAGAGQACVDEFDAASCETSAEPGETACSAVCSG